MVLRFLKERPAADQVLDLLRPSILPGIKRDKAPLIIKFGVRRDEKRRETAERIIAVVIKILPAQELRVDDGLYFNSVSGG